MSRQEAAARIPKTNAVRIVENARIPHEVCRHDFEEDTLDAVSAARKLRAPAETVFKTLVTRAEADELFVFCVPGNCELDPKKAARAAGRKKIELVKVKELFPFTGYIRGGCSPIGMKHAYPAYIDETAALHDWIYVNAGARGLQIKIRPTDLVRVMGAALADIV